MIKLIQRLIPLALIVLSIVSCTKEQEIIKTTKVTIRASFGDNTSSTKTSIDATGKVYWLPDDDFYVYSGADIMDNNTPSNFVTDIDSPSSSAIFTGDLDIDDNDTYFAFYPGASAYVDYGSYWGDDWDGSMDGQAIGCLSSEQHEAYDDDDRFDFDHNIMLAAMMEDGLDEVFFQNVCSGLKFSVSESGITAVKFRGNNGEDIAGCFSLDFFTDDSDEMVPFATPIEGDSSKEVKLDGYAGFFTGEWLYLLILPQTFEKGITITFEKDGTSFKSLVIDKPITFKRGIWKKAANIDLSASDLVPFKDQEVKRICVENWDTDGDGEISPAEAAAVTGLTGAFRESTITSFDELKYFTGLTTIPNSAFKNCKQLKSIVLPNTITLIRESAFYNCAALEEIIIPESVQTLGASAFESCDKLSSVVFEGTLAEDGIGSECFSSCSSLPSIVIPEGPKTIPYRCFYNCGSLKYIVFPSTVTKIEKILEKGILSEFAIEYFIVMATTPPKVSYDSQTYVFFTPEYQSILVFVPDDSVEAYRNDSLWGKFKQSNESHIYSIDQMDDILSN